MIRDALKAAYLAGMIEGRLAAAKAFGEGKGMRQVRTAPLAEPDEELLRSLEEQAAPRAENLA